MNLFFSNHCNHCVILTINDDVIVMLSPLETKSVSFMNSEVIKITAKRENKSERVKNQFNLILKTTYSFSGVTDGSTVTISREKMGASLQASYDRLFLSIPAARCLSETFEIDSEDRIKKEYLKFMKGMSLFDELLVSGTFIVFWLVICVFLGRIWDWRFVFFLFLIPSFIVVVLNLLIGKLWKKAGKKWLKPEDEKTEFYRCFEQDFIKEFYSNEDRVSYIGKAEFD